MFPLFSCINSKHTNSDFQAQVYVVPDSSEKDWEELHREVNLDETFLISFNKMKKSLQTKQKMSKELLDKLILFVKHPLPGLGVHLFPKK